MMSRSLHPRRLSRWLVPLALLVGGAVEGGMTSQISQAEEPTPTLIAQGEETLRLLYWQAPTILNPHLSTGTKDFEASRITYEPLASFNAAGEMVPYLAAEIPSTENGGVAEDYTSVTWTLKEGVTGSDGEPFPAEDVVFTFDYTTNPEVGSVTSAVYQTIESVEAVDDTTVLITFKEPTVAWFEPFVGTNGMILPEHIFGEFNGPNSREAEANLMPVGTGPYIPTDVRPGDVIVYEPNPNFREEGKPFFPRVELKGGGDATSAARAVLQTGDADYAWNVQVEAAVLNQLEAAGVGRVIPKPGPNVERIQFNFTDPNQEVNGERSSLETEHPFFTDLNVRKAFTLAINREVIAEQLYGQAGEATINLIVSPDTVKSDATYEYDLEQAAALLDEAGWVDSDNNGVRDQDGVEMSVLFQTSVNPLRQKTQEIIKQDLESIGVEVELKSTDASVYFDSEPANPDNIGHFYADLQMFTTGNENPDPTAHMRTYICEEINQQSNGWSTDNYSRYCNEEYDALYEELVAETDVERRFQLIKEMNDFLVLEDVAVMPIVDRFSPAAAANTVEGPDLTPWDLETWNIKDWVRVDPSS